MTKKTLNIYMLIKIIILYGGGTGCHVIQTKLEDFREIEKVSLTNAFIT